MADRPQEKKKIEPVIDKVPDTLKQSNAKKFFGNFVANDLADVKDYLIFNVALPRFKSLVLDSICRGAEMLIMGGTSPKTNSRSGYYGRENYNRMYDNNNVRSNNPRQGSSSMYAPYNDPVFDFEDEAWLVIDKMTEYVEEFPSISISEFLAFCNRSQDDEYTYQYYGWSRAAINAGRPEQISDGRWIIRLPKPKYIK